MSKTKPDATDQLLDNEDLDQLLDNDASAAVVGCTPATLKQSRHTGTLFGVATPEFMKMGRSVRYRPSTLLRFRSQFKERKNTIG